MFAAFSYHPDYPSPPLDPHLNLFCFVFSPPYSGGSREACRHALGVLGLWYPHSTHPSAEQVCNSGAAPQALEMEKEEEREVQADISWYVTSFHNLSA